MRNVLVNIAVLLISILSFFLVIEFGLRITGLQTVAPNPPKIYQRSENPNISYELKPNLKNEDAYRKVVTTNSLGFRSAEPNGKPVLAVLGDSITFGYSVEDEESLPSQLSMLMPEFDVQNAAVPGYNLMQERATFQEKIAPLNPEAVMLVFYWNDLDELRPGKLDDDGILRSADWVPQERTCAPITEGILAWIPAACWLDDHSAFYKAVKKVVNLQAGKRSQKEQRDEAQQNAVEPVKEENLTAYLEGLRNFAIELPANRTFVIWPDNLFHKTVRQRIIDEAEHSGFRVIDLYEHFGNEVPTLDWDTVHPNPDALKSAAEFIAEKLR